jgi:hypothetical protein
VDAKASVALRREPLRTRTGMTGKGPRPGWMFGGNSITFDRGSRRELEQDGLGHEMIVLKAPARLVQRGASPLELGGNEGRATTSV